MVPNGQRPRLFRPLDKHRPAHPSQLKGFPGLRSPATWPEMWEKRREEISMQCFRHVEDEWYSGDFNMN